MAAITSAKRPAYTWQSAGSKRSPRRSTTVVKKSRLARWAMAGLALSASARMLLRSSAGQGLPARHQASNSVAEVFTNQQLQLLKGDFRYHFLVCDQGVGQGRTALAFSLRGHCSYSFQHDLAGVLRILLKVGDDLGDSDRIVLVMPAIVISHHGHCDVAYLRLTGELRFLEVGHADDVHPPTTVHIGFGFRREGRPFHAQICAALFRCDGVLSAGCVDHICEMRTNRIGKADVGYQALSEKSRDASAGTIEELIGNHEIQRLVLFLHGSNGAKGDDTLHPELFEAVNVGPEVKLRGGDPMAAPVAGEKGHIPSPEPAQDVVVR